MADNLEPGIDIEDIKRQLAELEKAGSEAGRASQEKATAKQQELAERQARIRGKGREVSAFNRKSRKLERLQQEHSRLVGQLGAARREGRKFNKTQLGHKQIEIRNQQEFTDPGSVWQPQGIVPRYNLNVVRSKMADGSVVKRIYPHKDSPITPRWVGEEGGRRRFISIGGVPLPKSADITVSQEGDLWVGSLRVGDTSHRIARQRGEGRGFPTPWRAQVATEAALNNLLGPQRQPYVPLRTQLLETGKAPESHYAYLNRAYERQQEAEARRKSGIQINDEVSEDHA